MTLTLKLYYSYKLYSAEYSVILREIKYLWSNLKVRMPVSININKMQANSDVANTKIK